jgi:ankyrin repeat protein
MQEIKFKINFDSLDSSLVEALKYNRTDISLLLMEEDEYEIIDMTYKTKENIQEEEDHKLELNIHYKIDYYNQDESIIKNSLLQCIRSNPKIISKLFEKGINLYQPDIQGNYPIMYAIKSKNVDLLKQMIDLNYDLKIKNSSNMDALLYALHLEIEHQQILYDQQTKKINL